MAACAQLPQRGPDAFHLLVGRIGRHGDVIVLVDPQQLLHRTTSLWIGIQKTLAIPPVLVPEHSARQGVDQDFPFVEIVGLRIEKFVDPPFSAGGQHKFSPSGESPFRRLVDFHFDHDADHFVDRSHRRLQDGSQFGHRLILAEQGAADLG